MAKPQFPKKLFVERDDSDGDPSYYAHTTEFDAADSDGETATIGIYELVGTRKVRMVVEVE